MRALLLASVLLLGSQAAQASVVYNWVDVSGAGAASGFMQIDDGAFIGGHLNWSSDDTHPLPPPPPGPLSMNFFYFGGQEGGVNQSSPLGTFSFNLTMLGNLLDGSIRSNNTGNNISMGSNGAGLWTIYDAATDGSGPCGQTSNSCGGDTGQWVLSTPAGVPEPASAALLGLSLAVFGVLRNHKERSDRAGAGVG